MTNGIGGTYGTTYGTDNIVSSQLGQTGSNLARTGGVIGYNSSNYQILTSGSSESGTGVSNSGYNILTKRL